MAGFIFSIYKEENIEGVKKCIKQGIYASKVPNDKLSSKENENSSNKSKQVMAAVLADYCSMQAGDNVYFLSDRRIYGVGKLVNVGPDCKYKNYLDTNACTECTGLINHGIDDREQWDSFRQIFDFAPEPPDLTEKQD